MDVHDPRQIVGEAERAISVHLRADGEQLAEDQHPDHERKR
jgi:hypothetical protein